MKLNKLFISALFTALVSTGASAQTLNTFSAGTPALASEVNQNFQILSDQIAGGIPMTVAFDTSQEVSRIQVTNVQINGGSITGQVAPGSTVNVTLDYFYAASTSCPGCIYQIMIGFAGEQEEQCIFSGSGFSDQSGSASFTLTAPAAPGNYFPAFNGNAQFNCTDSLNQNRTTPTTPAGRRFGVVSVN